MRCSASSRAATLSGLLPERAKCTIKCRELGAPAKLPGLATMSVVGDGLARRAPVRASAGARHSPMKDELPAPVSTMRSRGLGQQRCRETRAVPHPRQRAARSRGHRCGCCAISRAVHSAPREPRSAPRVSPSTSMGSAHEPSALSTGRRPRARRCVRRRCSRRRCRSRSRRRSDPAPRGAADCR